MASTSGSYMISISLGISTIVGLRGSRSEALVGLGSFLAIIIGIIALFRVAISI